MSGGAPSPEPSPAEPESRERVPGVTPDRGPPGRPRGKMWTAGTLANGAEHACGVHASGRTKGASAPE